MNSELALAALRDVEQELVFIVTAAERADTLAEPVAFFIAIQTEDLKARARATLTFVRNHIAYIQRGTGEDK